MGVPSWVRHAGQALAEGTTAAPLLCGGASPVARRKAAVRDAVVPSPDALSLTAGISRSLSHLSHKSDRASAEKGL